MKLNELFQTKTKERDVKSLNSFNRKFNSPRLGEIGHGKFASTKIKKSDPHMVQKIPNKAEYSLNNDAYYVYINTIVKEKIAQENPFAPRIYKINLFKDKDGQEKYTVEMERLIPMEDIKKDELNEYGIRLFGYIDPEYKDINWAIDTFCGRVSDIKYDLPSNDNNLNDLIKLIMKIKNKRGSFFYDFHEGNMMFRRGRYGIQLVITDPLAHFTDN